MSKIDHIEEIEKSSRYDQLQEVEKFNPYHDSRGRFSSSNGYASFTIQTKDPKKQYLADIAIDRMVGNLPPAKPKKPAKPQPVDTSKPQPVDTSKPQPVDTSKPPAGTKTQTDHPPGKNLTYDEKVDFVAKQTGASPEEAKEMFDAQKAFTDGLYKSIREAGFKGSPPASQKAKEQADLVDKMIEQSPKYDGEVYRGIGTDKATAAQIAQRAADGHLISQMGAASFSTDRKVAQNFAEGNEDGAIVIFVSKGVQNGTSVRATSQYFGEQEVMMSSKATWKPTGKVTKMKQGYLTAYTIEMEPFWGDPAAYEAEIPQF